MRCTNKSTGFPFGFPLWTAAFVLWICCTPLFAAAPVTHALLAEKWMAAQEQYDDMEKRSFIIGTLFPDIRYMGDVKRSDTHEKGVTVKRLKEKQNAFLKGKRLHVFVDELREKCVVKWKMYDKIQHVPNQRRRALFLKLLEDEILYPKQDWQQVRNYLTHIDPEERKFQIEVSKIKRWHRNQSMAFTALPSDYIWHLALFNKSFAGVKPEVLREWSKILPKMAKDPEMQHYVEKLLKEFDKVFS